MTASDPFDILGLPARFDLAPADLRTAFLARSAALHPDIAAFDEDSDTNAAALNQAKRTLEDPEARAEALLLRLGGPAKEKDRSLPPDFLQEMLEVREEIEEAAATRDPALIDRWENWARERRKAHVAAVSRLFADFELGGVGGARDPGVLSAIRMELNMWRYVERLIQQLGDAER